MSDNKWAREGIPADEDEKTKNQDENGWKEFPNEEKIKKQDKKEWQRIVNAAYNEWKQDTTKTIDEVVMKYVDDEGTVDWVNTANDEVILASCIAYKEGRSIYPDIEKDPSQAQIDQMWETTKRAIHTCLYKDVYERAECDGYDVSNQVLVEHWDNECKRKENTSIRFYNRNLEPIENAQLEKRIHNILEKNIAFLVEHYGIDESFLRKKIRNVSVVMREGKKTHFVIQNGERIEVNSAKSASFVTKKNLDLEGDRWTFENAIYTSDTNGDHTLSHEAFHFIAENTEMEYDANGIGYDKRGISIATYDKNDESEDYADERLHAVGLNEGVTEMLAMKVDGMNEPRTYLEQECFAEILANSQDNSLINAYFSEDYREFEKFLEDFDARQSTTSSKKLVELSKISGNPMDVELLKGCMEYSLSFCQNMEQLNSEGQRLLPIFKRMYNYQGWALEFSDENINLKQFFKDIIRARKQEIQEQTKSVQELGKEVLPELGNNPKAYSSEARQQPTSTQQRDLGEER